MHAIIRERNSTFMCTRSLSDNGTSAGHAAPWTDKKVPAANDPDTHSVYPNFKACTLWRKQHGCNICTSSLCPCNHQHEHLKREVRRQGRGCILPATTHHPAQQIQHPDSKNAVKLLFSTNFRHCVVHSVYACTACLRLPHA